MLHLPMTTLRHLALREPTSSRNAFFPGAPGLIMRANPRRMISLHNSTLQVPWNHILAENTRGWGVCPYRFRAGCHPKAAMFAMPAPSVRIANDSYCGRRCHSTGVEANLTPELYSPSAVWSLQFNENLDGPPAMKCHSANIRCVRGRAGRRGDQIIGLMAGRRVELGTAPVLYVVPCTAVLGAILPSVHERRGICQER
jgi:hypothetical protein